MIDDHEAKLLDLPVLLGDLDLQVVTTEGSVILVAAQVDFAFDAPLPLILGYSLHVVRPDGDVKIEDFGRH